MLQFLRNIFPDRVTDDTVKLLTACLAQISDERVAMALPQLKAGLLRFESPNPIREPNYVGFTYFPNISARFEDPLGRSLRVTNICISSQDGFMNDKVSIYFSRGLVAGYAFERNRNFLPDIRSIDTSRARIEFLDQIDTTLDSLIGPDERKYINWSDVFEVELNGKVFYHLKDIGNGDFIGIDNQRNVYKVYHDPPRVQRLPGELINVLKTI